MVERQLFLQAVTRVGFYLETSIFLPGTIQNRQEKAGRGVNIGNVRDFSGQRLRNLVRLLDSEQAVFSVCRPEISTAYYTLTSGHFIILHCGCSFFKTVQWKCSPAPKKQGPQTGRALCRALQRMSSLQEEGSKEGGRPHFQM